MRLFKYKLILENPPDGDADLNGLNGLTLVLKAGALVARDTTGQDHTVSDPLKIVQLLREPMTPSPYKLQITPDGYVTVHMDDGYIRKIIQHTWLIPPVLKQLFKPMHQTTFDIKDEMIAPAEPYLGTFLFPKSPNFELYPYQKGNVSWMLNLENIIDRGMNYIEYISKDDIYEFKGLYLDIRQEILYDKITLYDSQWMFKYYYKGGILCDDVGLGKTLSMISLIEQSGDPLPTLVLCPRRLTGQWIAEIKKYGSRGIEISTMPHINKYGAEQIRSAKIVVVSLSLLENKNYIVDKILSGIEWARLIIDEGHEILRNVHKMNTLLKDIYSFKTRYKWICSGTPLAYGDDSMLSLLTFLNDSMRKTSLLEHLAPDQFQKLVADLFHRNTRESIQSQIFIPGVQHHVDRLDFTPTEMAMYDAIPQDDVNRKLQLCSNITISDKDASIMGGGVILSIDQINKAMGTHYKTLCTTIELDIQAAKDKSRQLYQESTDVLAELNLKITAATDAEEIKLLKHDRAKRTISYRSRLKTLEENIVKYGVNLENYQKQLQKFRSLDLTHLKHAHCPILGMPLTGVETAITTEGCYYSKLGLDLLFTGGRKEVTCPCSGRLIKQQDIVYVHSQTDVPVDYSWGTKMTHIIRQVQQIIADAPMEKIIIFSRWNKMLKLVGHVLDTVKISHVFCRGNVHSMSHSINRFKNEAAVKIILLSSENCSSGCHLTEASHILLLDTTSEDPVSTRAINEQAIGRALRLGQKNTVHVYNFIINNTLEETFFNAL
jgi:hypothetical protein